MFDAHPPFQIDGNFGGTSGIAEMLLQSRLNGGTTELDIMPALPHAFATGSVRGLRARGGFVIDISWRDGSLTAARIKSLLGRPLTVRYGVVTSGLTIPRGRTIIWRGDGEAP